MRIPDATALSSSLYDAVLCASTIPMHGKREPPMACQVETDAGTISAYIVFLSQHTSDLQLQELDELVLDVATLIVERATLINHLLPSEGATSPRSDLVLVAMVNLFHSYLRKAQEEQAGYVWSNTQDQILLRWESGTSATVNVLVVHAMIILLTYGAPQGESQYESLLDAWFPPGGRPPTAFLVDTSEEALLLPDWLKLRMIRSTSLRLVEAALQDLEPGQLLLFVQSFGIPVASMSRLLQCLDAAVEDDPRAMEASVVDKGYMAQLIEVQHMRGAVGGQKFRALLREGSEPTPPEPEEIDITSPVRRRRLQSELSRAPDVLPPQPDAKQTLDLLHKIFVAKETQPADRQLMHRSLVKMIAKDPEICLPIVKALNKLLTSHKGSLVAALLSHQVLACALIRILMAKVKKQSGDLVSLLRKVKEHLKPGDAGALAQLVTQFLNKHAAVTTETVVQEKMQYLQKKGGKSVAQALTYGLGTEDGQEHLGGYQEAVTNSCLHRSLQDGTAKQITQTVTKLVHQSLKRGEINSATQRLLVDWLELLDPEMISANPAVEHSLLFGCLEKKEKAKAGTATEGDDSTRKSKRRSLQSYLLALLTHHTSWSSLHHCISLLLQSESLSKFDSTSALDFLWSCIHIPKIWQGRDKKLPKNYVPEDVLQLTAEQVQVLVDYMTDEASLLPRDQIHSIVDTRIALLLRACCQRRDLLRAVTQHLYDKLKLNKNRRVVRHILMQLYLRVPHSLSLIDKDPACQLTTVSQSTEGTCQLDTVTHALVTALGNCGFGKNMEDRLLDANLALRKIGLEHPLLLLRQLPLLAAMLTGRCQFSFDEFRHRNHHLLFTHALGLLELLQPHVFHSQHREPFALCLQTYFEFIQRHCLDNKQMASVVTKFVVFLSSFMTYDAVKASQMLKKYIPTLSALTQTYPEFGALKSLLAGLNLPHAATSRSRETPSPSPSSGDAASDDDEDAPALLELQRPASPPLSGAQLLPFQRRIGKGASLEDTLEVLRDLDDTSKRKVDIIQPFLNDLKRLMLHNNETARNTSHLLIMRYVRHAPKSAGEFVSVFKRCLDAPNMDIVNSGLRNLPEFCLLAQEKAVELLLKAFRVGVHSKVESAAHIAEAMSLLNLETLQ